MTAHSNFGYGNGVQVSGSDSFEGNRWREAILCYLFGVWSNNDDVVYRPKMRFEGRELFGGLSLRLDTQSKTYFALAESVTPTEFPLVKRENVLQVSAEQTEVEVGLARFVKDNAIRMLKIVFGEGAELALWKHQSRGQFSFAGKNLRKFPGC